MNEVTSRDGTRIAFDRTGVGPPLVLVGGALSDRSAARALTELLVPTFQVIAFDRRGRGDSADTPPYAVEREIEDLRALVEEAGGSAYVFGHSSGAVLALDATARGLPAERLALYEPPFVVDGSRPPLPAGYVEHLDRLTVEGRSGDAVEYFMTAGVGLPAEVAAGMREEPYWSALEALARTIAYDGRIMEDTMGGRPLPGDRWDSVAVPTLVMDGEDSPDWARTAVAALVDVLPNAERRTLPGQTHDAAPELLAPMLLAFFGE